MAENPPLHVCFRCRGKMVYPVEWTEEGPVRWRLVLRCPDCEAMREGVFERLEVERFNDELERSAAEVRSDLERVTRSNMSEEIERFTDALESDGVVPEDF